MLGRRYQNEVEDWRKKRKIRGDRHQIIHHSPCGALSTTVGFVGAMIIKKRMAAKRGFAYAGHVAGVMAFSASCLTALALQGSDDGDSVPILPGALQNREEGSRKGGKAVG